MREIKSGLATSHKQPLIHEHPVDSIHDPTASSRAQLNWRLLDGFDGFFSSCEWRVPKEQPGNWPVTDSPATPWPTSSINGWGVPHFGLLSSDSFSIQTFLSGCSFFIFIMFDSGIFLTIISPSIFSYFGISRSLVHFLLFPI